RVDAALGERLDAWSRAHRDACLATHVRHEQSDALLDRRMRCLGRARAEIAALVGALETASGVGLDRAAGAAAEVGAPGPCPDPDALLAERPPPRDAAPARAVDELRVESARLGALRLLGAWKDGLALGRELVGRARALGYDPLTAAI